MQCMIYKNLLYFTIFLLHQRMGDMQSFRGTYFQISTHGEVHKHYGL